MILQLKQVQMVYPFGQYSVQALRGIDLEIEEKEFLAISGQSGSGKTTLLNIIGCLERPTAGQVFFDGADLAKMDESSLADLRAQKIGFVFQTFNLLPVLTAAENTEYALLNLGIPARERARMSQDALERVGLGKFADRRPDQLSGGQRQRVAIARALVKKPRLIVADEPTANLDSKTAGDIIDLLHELNRQDGLTVVIASHDGVVLNRAEKIVKMADGVRLA